MAVSLHAVPVDQLGSLSLHTFRCTPGPGDAASVEATICGLRDEQLDDAIIIAARDGTLTVGVAVAVPTRRPGTWHISMLAMRVPWQSKGHGRRLKERCLDAIYEAGGSRVVSSVHSATVAMNRINQTIAGSEWLPEVDGPGVVY